MANFRILCIQRNFKAKKSGYNFSETQERMSLIVSIFIVVFSIHLTEGIAFFNDNFFFFF